MYYGNESDSEKEFLKGGPFWHLCTSPLETDILFRDKDEFGEGLNYLGLAASDTACDLLAYSLMSNHAHFIIEGTEDSCLVFWERFRRRLDSFLTRTERGYLAKAVVVKHIPINNLKQLKNEICYVIRNQFVVMQNSNIFSCMWNSGHLYFNEMLPMMKEGAPAAAMKVSLRRAFKHERNPDIDPHLMVLDGIAVPASFVNYRRAEVFFSSAREFLQCTMKNVESQVEIAKRLGEKPNLNDSEIWDISRKTCRGRFGITSPKEMTSEQLVELARTLKFDYSASNAQIARTTGIRLVEVNRIFPLSAPQ